MAEQAAKRHGLKSTCMAKPYGEHAGSGLHVHASIVDADGNNILDAKGGDPVLLKSVTAGMLNTMRDAQLIFAPFANSYRRFQPGSFAPSILTGVLVIAARQSASRTRWARCTHRTSRGGCRCQSLPSADSDPGRHAAGLDETLDPGPATEPGQAAPDNKRLTHDFLTAVEDFAASPFIGRVFGERYQKLYGDTKRKEAITYLRTVSDFDYRTYLTRI